MPPTSCSSTAIPSLLTVVNVWDAISASVVADVPGTRALATASHSIAATLGYPDGEQIPVEEMLDMCRRIVEAVDLPVSADLEGGYGDAPDTIRRAIGVGVVGANLEDQMKPLAEAAAQVEAVMAAAAAEGVPDFVLNARTDAFVKAGDRDPADVLADAVERTRAYVDAGAPVVFVPGKLDEQQVTTLVDALGPQRLTLIGVPGSLPLARARGARGGAGVVRPQLPAGRAHRAPGAGRGRARRRRAAGARCGCSTSAAVADDDLVERCGRPPTACDRGVFWHRRQTPAEVLGELAAAAADLGLGVGPLRRARRGRAGSRTAWSSSSAPRPRCCSRAAPWPSSARCGCGRTGPAPAGWRCPTCRTCSSTSSTGRGCSTASRSTT